MMDRIRKTSWGIQIINCLIFVPRQDWSISLIDWCLRIFQIYHGMRTIHIKFTSRTPVKWKITPDASIAAAGSCI